jgi:sodium-independent sulfate anion transporter 11
MIKTLAGHVPAALIVLVIEHISIAKSFGRINNYTINPSQELIAIGATNMLGPFLGAYASTGSCSRTAIKSKCGVRTPFAGVITAGVVLLALYTLTPIFFFVPTATLAAVIIHAVRQARGNNRIAHCLGLFTSKLFIYLRSITCAS